MKKIQTSICISLTVSFIWLIGISFGFYNFFQSSLTLEMLIFGTQDFIRENLFLGICIFVGVYVVRPLFFIPATPFDVFSGMVFGPILGFIVCSISTLLSTMFSYWVGYLTGGIVLEKKNFSKLEKLKGKLAKSTFRTTFMMRLVMLPFDLSNYICGVLQAPYVKYVFGTWLGVQAATIVFVGAGAAFYGQNITSYDTLIENVNYSYLMFSSAFFISIIILSKVVKEKYGDLSIK